MQSWLLALSLALAGQAAPRPSATAPAPAAQATSHPSRAEIYQAAKKALNEARLRAMQKDLSLRARAVQASRDATLKALCARYSLPLDELLSIIDEGEQEDGTAVRKQGKNSSAKAAAKQRNMAMLGAIGAQVNAEADAYMAKAAAQQRAVNEYVLNPLGRQTAALNAQLRNSPTFTPMSGYYVGPRQPPGTYIGGVGSSHRGGHYSNSATGDRYQKSSP